MALFMCSRLYISMAQHENIGCDLTCPSGKPHPEINPRRDELKSFDYACLESFQYDGLVRLSQLCGSVNGVQDEFHDVSATLAGEAH